LIARRLRSGGEDHRDWIDMGTVDLAGRNLHTAVVARGEGRGGEEEEEEGGGVWTPLLIDSHHRLLKDAMTMIRSLHIASATNERRGPASIAWKPRWLTPDACLQVEKGGG
jgi:hypothetical protein